MERKRKCCLIFPTGHALSLSLFFFSWLLNIKSNSWNVWDELQRLLFIYPFPLKVGKRDLSKQTDICYCTHAVAWNEKHIYTHYFRVSELNTVLLDVWKSHSVISQWGECVSPLRSLCWSAKCCVWKNVLSIFSHDFFLKQLYIKYSMTSVHIYCLNSMSDSVTYDLRIKCFWCNF